MTNGIVANYDKPDDWVMSMSPSRSETLARTVADTLRQAIWDGVYPCGERLIELTIAHELNVSQNTVREALRILEQEGWLVHHSRRGVFVRSFTADEAEEVYELWALLEGAAFSRVAEKITRVDFLNALRPFVQDAKDALAVGRWLGAWEALLRFHQTIAQLSERPQMFALLSQIYNQARLLEIEYEFHQPRTLESRIQRIEAYEHLLGVIKFADSATGREALMERIIDEGKPVVRYLAMHM
jgi:DNA-binding GntR family transcriptional regulator